MPTGLSASGSAHWQFKFKMEQVSMMEKLTREILAGKNITQKEAVEAASTPVADDLDRKSVV